MTPVKSLACALVLWAAAGSAGAIGDGMGGDTVDSPIPVPSGHTVVLQDVVTSAEGSTGLAYRFRFVAPWIADEPDFHLVSKDMEYLCEAYALPRLSNIGPSPSQIVVSFADRRWNSASPPPRPSSISKPSAPRGQAVCGSFSDDSTISCGGKFKDAAG